MFAGIQTKAVIPAQLYPTFRENNNNNLNYGKTPRNVQLPKLRKTNEQGDQNGKIEGIKEPREDSPGEICW